MQLGTRLDAQSDHVESTIIRVNRQHVVLKQTACLCEKFLRRARVRPGVALDDGQ